MGCDLARLIGAGAGFVTGGGQVRGIMLRCSNSWINWDALAGEAARVAGRACGFPPR
jgi:hypothetical protein